MSRKLEMTISASTGPIKVYSDTECPPDEMWIGDRVTIRELRPIYRDRVLQSYELVGLRKLRDGVAELSRRAREDGEPVADDLDELLAAAQDPEPGADG